MSPGRLPVLLLLVLLAGCKVDLLTGLAENDANQMLALLQGNAISAAKVRQKDGRDTLVVESAQFGRAVEMLREAGFPRQRFESMGDVFQPSGLVASPLQERARFLWALGQELSRTISDIDGVLTARVQVVLPNNDLLNRDPTPSSASVFVRFDRRSPVEQLVPQIKQLVANSVEGLSYDKVSVVLVPASPPAAVSAALAPAPAMEWEPVVAGGGVLAGLLGLGAAVAQWRRRTVTDSAMNPAE